MVDFSIAVKAFIVNSKNELLTVKRRSHDVHAPGVWDIPGGRLDSIDESPFEGVIRETKEEVGLDIQVLNPLMVDHFTRDDGQKITMLIFLCKPLSEDVKLSEEHVEFAWTHIDKVEDKLVHHFHSTLENYRKHFKSS